MARVVKDADVRRKEILDTALGLFMQVGYERTSVEMITAAVGVSKGNFYHYFDSKQELLGELAGEYADVLFDRAEASMRTAPGDAAQRLGLLMRNSAAWKAEQREATLAFSRSLYSEENLRLRSELMGSWGDRLTVILTGLITEGVDEGSFHVADATWAADTIVALWLGWADRHAAEMVATLEGPPELLPALAQGLDSLETAMERILGVPDGSLELGFRGALDAFTDDRPAVSA